VASPPRSAVLPTCSGHARSTTRCGNEVRAYQAAQLGRLSYPPGSLAELLAREPSALVRVGVGSAYVPYVPEDGRSEGARRLAERVRVALDPREVLL
jgi:hypothetical protein